MFWVKTIHNEANFFSIHTFRAMVMFDFAIKEIRLLKQQIDSFIQAADDSDSILCVPLTKAQAKNIWWKTPCPLPELGKDSVVFI